MSYDSIIFRQSARVILRPIIEEDLPKITKWMNNPKVTMFLTSSYPLMEAEEREWFLNLPKNKPQHVVVAIVVDGTIIGTMGLHNINHRHRTATTGAVIGEEAYWGKGYGSEAKMLLLDYAFHVLNLRKICSLVIAYNERSINYSLKCGYKEEARLREHFYSDGTYWDEVCLAVFYEQSKPLWDTFKATRLP